MSSCIESSRLFYRYLSRDFASYSWLTVSSVCMDCSNRIIGYVWQLPSLVGFWTVTIGGLGTEYLATVADNSLTLSLSILFSLTSPFLSSSSLRMMSICYYMVFFKSISFITSKEVKANMAARLIKMTRRTLSWLGVFGDGLGAFRNGVSGKFSWQDKLDGRLDLP